MELLTTTWINVVEHAGRRHAIQARREVPGLPDDPFEELLEGIHRLGVVELEVDDYVAGIADGLTNPLRPDAGTLACVRESVEGTKPCFEVRDRMLDVQCRHAPSFDPPRPTHLLRSPVTMVRLGPAAMPVSSSPR